MGRGVSVPPGAVATVYLDVLDIEDEWQFEDLRKDIQVLIRDHYPSFDDCEQRVDREGQAILENDHAYVVLAEYCGCASVSLAPKDDRYDGRFPALAEAWGYQIADRWRRLLQDAFPGQAMVRVGGMSNGTSVYRKVSA